MKYWPFSILATSPLLPEAYLHEVSRMLHRVPSHGAYMACVDIARRTPAVVAPNLFIVESTDCPYRRMFIGHPEGDEFLRLERGIFIEDVNGYLFGSIEALH